jgi:hypothetical protein
VEKRKRWRKVGKGKMVIVDEKEKQVKKMRVIVQHRQTDRQTDRRRRRLGWIRR